MEAESTKACHGVKDCWITPEDALESLNYFCKFGENDKPVRISECFQVWGRGRPRPQLDQIILPKGTSLQSNFPQEKSIIGRGRGWLLLENTTFDNDSKQDPGPSVMFNSNHVHCIDKQIKKFRKGKGQSNVACPKVTLKELEEKYNKARYLGSQKPFFDINNDFPPL